MSYGLNEMAGSSGFNWYTPDLDDVPQPHRVFEEGLEDLSVDSIFPAIYDAWTPAVLGQDDTIDVLSKSVEPPFPKTIDYDTIPYGLFEDCLGEFSTDAAFQAMYDEWPPAATEQAENLDVPSKTVDPSFPTSIDSDPSDSLFDPGSISLRSSDSEFTVPEVSKVEGVRNTILTILPRSKMPVIDALVYCALKNLGASIIRNDNRTIEFRVHDWKTLFDNCWKLENKKHPTTDVSHRLKTLKRWFTNVPEIKRPLTARTIAVKTNTKDNKVAKIRNCIAAIRKTIGNTE